MIQSPNIRGAVLMTISMVAFVLNDTALKLSGADVGIFQSIFIRGLFAMCLLFGIAAVRESFQHSISKRDQRLIGFRTLAEIGATLAFVTALFNMPLANATAIMQLTPLVMALGAAVVFKERVSSRQLVAIVIGLGGVLLIIRPNATEFNIFTLFCLAAVVFSVVRDLIVRSFETPVSSLVVTCIATLGMTLASGICLVVGQTWVPLETMDIVLLAVSALFLSVGYFCAVAAMRIGAMAFVSAFRYSVLLWAVALGWFVFGDFPDAWTFIGMGTLVVSGLLLVAKKASPQPPT